MLFAIPYVEGQALASGQQESTGVSVRGIDAASIEKLTLLKNGAVLGGWDQWDQSKGVAIGQRLAEKLGLTIGDPITIVNPNGANTPFGKTPADPLVPGQRHLRPRHGRVRQLLRLHADAGGADLLQAVRGRAASPASASRRPDATDEQIDAAYERKYQATAVEVFIDDPDNVTAVRDRIQTDVDRPLILYDWQQRNETFFSALQVERVVMFTILSMIILVAAFNIISSLVMLVKDKGSDIAILRTMGATRGSIMRIFSMTGIAIGVAGTVIGLVLGRDRRLQRRAAARLRLEPHQHADLSARGVLPLDACRPRSMPAEVTVVALLALGPELPRDALSGLARGAVRPGRGAAL